MSSPANLNPNQIISSISPLGDTNNLLGTLTVTGNVTATSSSPAVVLNNSSTQIGGSIVSIQSGGSQVANFDYTGHVYLSYSSSYASSPTQNTSCGKSVIKHNTSSTTVTNSLVTANSIVLATIAQPTADSSLTSIVDVVVSANSFVLTGNATAANNASATAVFGTGTAAVTFTAGSAYPDALGQSLSVVIVQGTTASYVFNSATGLITVTLPTAGITSNALATAFNIAISNTIMTATGGGTGTVLIGSQTALSGSGVIVNWVVFN
jgi:hypothetical protein